MPSYFNQYSLWKVAIANQILSENNKRVSNILKPFYNDHLLRLSKLKQQPAECEYELDQIMLDQ